jgi:hypothetical protein
MKVCFLAAHSVVWTFNDGMFCRGDRLSTSFSIYMYFCQVLLYIVCCHREHTVFLFFFTLSRYHFLLFIIATKVRYLALQLFPFFPFLLVITITCPFSNLSDFNFLNGALAWDIRHRDFYTNQTCMDWPKKGLWLQPYFYFVISEFFFMPSATALKKSFFIYVETKLVLDCFYIPFNRPRNFFIIF